MVEINSEKCTGCNQCFMACPYGIIEKGPVVREIKKLHCVSCGHCYAVCPQAAITMDGDTGEEVPVCPTDISTDSMLGLLVNRRSGRSFQPVPVSDEDMELLLRAASAAPSATNARLVKAYVIRNASLIDELRTATGNYYATLRKMFTLPGASVLARIQGVSKARFERVLPAILHITEPPEGKDPLFYHSRTLMVFTIPAKAGEETVGDAWIAAQNVVVMAETIPVTTCYNGFFTFAISEYPHLKKIMGVPQDEKVIAALMMGYPKTGFKRLPRRGRMTVEWK